MEIILKQLEFPLENKYFLFYCKLIKALRVPYDHLQEFELTKKLKIKIKVKFELNLFVGILAENSVSNNRFSRTDHSRS